MKTYLKEKDNFPLFTYFSRLENGVTHENIFSVVEEMLKNKNFKIRKNGLLEVMCWDSRTYKGGVITLKRFSKNINISLHIEWNCIDDDFQYGKKGFDFNLKLNENEYEEILKLLKRK